MARNEDAVAGTTPVVDLGAAGPNTMPGDGPSTNMPNDGPPSTIPSTGHSATAGSIAPQPSRLTTVNINLIGFSPQDTVGIIQSIMGDVGGSANGARPRISLSTSSSASDAGTSGIQPSGAIARVGALTQTGLSITPTTLPSLPGTSGQQMNTGLFGTPTTLPSLPGTSGTSSGTQMNVPQMPWEGGSNQVPVCKICCLSVANRVLRHCGHFVCHACISNWLGIRNSCPDPYCRRECTMADVVSL